MGVAMAVLCWLVIVEGAVAGTVSRILDTSQRPARHVIRYDSGSGERNDVRLWLDFVHDPATGEYRQRALVSDQAGVDVGEGCVGVEGSPTTAACDTQGLGSLWLFDVRTGDRDDRVVVEKAGVDGARLVGGRGNDTLVGGLGVTTIFFGGAGDDTMNSNGATTAVFDEGSRPNGGDVMEGYGWVDYSARRRAVSADSSGSRDDGERGERDTIVGVPGLVGGRGADRLVGDGGANTLLGGPGRDVIAGGAGDDYLDAEWTGRAIPASSRRTHDLLSGGPGRDFLQAGPGGNVLRGGGGTDVLAGDRGSDRLVAVDGLPDEVRCAGGRDRLRQDGFDFHRGCEQSARQAASPVPLMAIAEANKYGDRYVYVRLGCPGKRAGRRCAGTVQLEVDGAVQSTAPFDRPWALTSLNITEASGFPLLAFDEVWALVREGSPRVSIAVSTPDGETTTRLPLPVIPRAFLNSAYLPQEAVDHVGPRPR
jgi:hypothetical protein